MYSYCYLLMIVLFSIQTAVSLLCPTLYWYLILTINFRDSIAQEDSVEGAGALAKTVGLQAHNGQLRALGRGPPAGVGGALKALSREGMNKWSSFETWLLLKRRHDEREKGILFRGEDVDWNSFLLPNCTAISSRMGWQ